MATFQMNFLSRRLGMMTNISVILPSLTPADDVRKAQPYYDRGVQYQTLWLLHDYTGDDADFIKFTNIVRYAEANKLAVVMPCGYNKMYTNAPLSSQFFSYIVEELPKLCQAFFPLSSRREDNFIAGIGMGASGALKAAFRFPGQYAAVLALSEGFGKPEDDDAGQAWLLELKQAGKIPPLAPDDVPAEEFDLTIPARASASAGGLLPKIFMAWGEKDGRVAARAHNGADLLREYGYDVVAREIAGAGRNWDLWDHALRQAVESWLPLKRRHVAL